VKFAARLDLFPPNGASLTPSAFQPTVLAASPLKEEQVFNTPKVTVIAAGHAVHDTYSAFLPALLPVLIQKFSLIKTEAGLLTVFATAPSLLQPVIGYLADRASLRRFVIVAPAVTAITMSFLGVAPFYAVAAMLLIIAGISSASLHATGPVMAGRLSANRLGLGMSFWMVGGELGRVFGPIIIATALTTMGPQRTPWISLVGILASVVLYIQLRKVKGNKHVGKPALEWGKALKAMRPILLPVTAIVVFRAFAFVSATTFLPTFLTEEGADLVFAGASLSVMEVGGVAGALLGGAFSDKIGRRPVVWLSLIMTSLFLFLLMATREWMQFPVLIGLGFCMLSLTPVVMAIVQESFPENRALANGIYMAVTFVSSSVAAVVVGAFGDLFDLRTAFSISAGLILIGLPFVFKIPGKPLLKEENQ
jgi:MFS transporter, FSR family, fosmidomycin resistance protein